MAVYLHSEQQIERMISQSRRTRVWYCVVAFLVLAVACMLVFYRPTLPIFREPMRAWVIAILVSLFLFPLLRTISSWRNWSERKRSSLREMRVEISPGTVGVFYPLGCKRQLSTAEIVRTEEPTLGGGLYLRTSNRYRWIMVPRKIDGYETIKRDMAGMGVPLVHKFVPTNWEEFLGVLLFIGTMICSFTAHSPGVLAVNLLVSILVALGGIWVINSNPDNSPRMRWRRFGAFLPVGFAALGLWFALHG
jgi:hypothetical protein